MQPTITLWITVICAVVNNFARAQECSSTDLEGNVVYCQTDDTKLYNASKSKSYHFPEGSRCLVENSTAVTFFQCDNAIWNIIDIKVTTDLHRHRRRKRFLGFIVNFIKGIFGGRDGPPADQTPPNIICIPPVIYATAAPYSTKAQVSWSEPMAHDDRDGHIKPTRFGGSPGEYFPEGTSVVTYVAKDRSGNSATCSVRVIIKVVRCNLLQNLPNAFFICQPINDFIYGCGCNFYCHQGFELHGPEHTRCGGKGQWSDAQPTCKPIRCPALPHLTGAGLPRCTNGFNFRSICSYECSSGYDMPLDVSRILVCENTKKWKSYGKPECIDVEPPVFEECPSVVIFGTDYAMNSTTVTWYVPQIRDNSNKAYVYQTHGVSPGSRLTAGVYSIKYSAKDPTGNKVTTDCAFRVIVRDVRCPRLYPTPYVHFRCPNGYLTGSMCSTFCDSGKVMIGTSYLECIRSIEGMYGYWNWRNGRQTICASTNKCVPLTPPIDGAVACDNWEGGQYCQVQCKNGTEIAGSRRGNKLYVCSTQGKWSAKPPVLETCREVRDHTQHTLGITASYYFDGECTSNSTRQIIAQNFITAVDTSLFSLEACPSSKECNSGNVQVKCGKSTSNRQKRSSYKMSSYNMSVEIIVNLPPNMFINETPLSKEKQVLNLLQVVKSNLDNNETVFESGMPNQLSDFGIHVHCPRGSVKSEKSLNCNDCPTGTYFTYISNERTCQSCKKGTYQNASAELLCIRCPIGTSTRKSGAMSEAECEDACLPGTFSNDGIWPCSPCEQGYFQPSYGQLECLPCSSSKSTVNFGSASKFDCKEFDIEFVPGEISKIHLDLSKQVTLTDFTLSFWLQLMPNNGSDNDEHLSVKLTANGTNDTWILENLYEIMWKNILYANVSFNLNDTRWHKIVIYWDSDNLTISVDDHTLRMDIHTDLPTINMAFDAVTLFSNGTGVSLSQLNIWHGKHNSHSQICFTSNVGDILSWKKFEEAELMGSFLNFPSQCDDFDSCASSPCMHGTCQDVLHSFECECRKGFQGKLCDINIDDCEANICMNNATCVDDVMNYTCACAENFKGSYCEITIVNGQWSDWGYWSECSTTCGDGLRQRGRLCNSPVPAYGGKLCEGDSFDFKDCNISDCPSCPKLTSPNNGSVTCHNETESINCTISCDEEFEFDIEPLTYYNCGQHTFYEWNFQTDENPERRLPECVEIKLPTEVEVSYQANYQNLYCLDMVSAKLTTEQINTVVESKIKDLTCVKRAACILGDFQITNCEVNNSRTRRSPNTAGFRVQITSQPNAENKSDKIQVLEDALQEIQITAVTRGFVINVQDEEFDVDVNFTDMSGHIECRAGETRVQYFCVPCGVGAYLETDYCKPCPIGTYQTEEGQLNCINCPVGTTTTGIRSASLTDCSVSKIVKKDEIVDNKNLTVAEVVGIVFGCIAALATAAIVIFVLKRHRISARKQRSADNNSFGQAGLHSLGSFIKGSSLHTNIVFDASDESCS